MNQRLASYLRRIILVVAAGVAACAPAAPAVPTTQAPANPAAGSAASGQAVASPPAQAVASPAAQAAPAKPGLTPITFTSLSPSANYLAVFAAKDGGYFEKYGLDVTIVIVANTPVAIASLSGGDSQFAIAGPNLVDSVAAGAPIVAVLAIANVPVFQIMAAADIKTAKDLIGKSVNAGNRGSGPDLGFRAYLQKEGIDANQINLPNSSGGNQEILAQGKIGVVQAIVLSAPVSYTAEEFGFHQMADLVSLKVPLWSAGVITTTTYRDQHPEVVLAFTRAFIDALARLKADDAFGKSVITNWVKITDPAILTRTLQFYRSAWADPPASDEAGLLNAIQLGTNEQTKSKGKDLIKQMYDNSFVQKALPSRSSGY